MANDAISSDGWRFWIDRGGTFTDIVARAPDGALRTAKLLSDNPDQYEDAAVEGVRRILKAPPSPLPAGLVADIRMEGINGLDTIEQARQIQPDIGSIVVSGFASEEETLRAVKLNVAGYLKKPFRVPELLELINTFLAQRSEKLRQAKELRGLREALLWSLSQQLTSSASSGASARWTR